MKKRLNRQIDGDKLNLNGSGYFYPRNKSNFEQALIINSTLTRGNAKLRKSVRDDIFTYGQDALDNYDKYGLTYCLVLAVEYFYRRNSKKMLGYKRHPTPEEFETVVTESFAPNGGIKETPSHSLPDSFEVSEYCPSIFFYLRKRNNIDPAFFVESLTRLDEFIKFRTNSKSGAYFFYSYDGQFIIKTMKKSERTKLLQILPSYYAFVNTNIHSLIAPICALFHVKASHLDQKTTFLIMRNVFYQSSLLNNPIHKIFDLKGSIAGRKRKQGEIVSKDVDFVEEKIKLRVGKMRPVLLKQLHKDIQFLCENNLMDYSLLVGVHNRRAKNLPTLDLREGEFVNSDEQAIEWLNEATNLRQRLLEDLEISLLDNSLNHEDSFEEFNPAHVGLLNNLPDSEDTEVYFLGLIDLFQSWNPRKKMEGTIRGMISGKQAISARPPVEYASRVFKFLCDSIEGEELEEELPSFLNGSSALDYSMTSSSQVSRRTRQSFDRDGAEDSLLNRFRRRGSSFFNLD